MEIRDDAVERAKAINEAVERFTQQGLEVPEYLAGLVADLVPVAAAEPVPAVVPVPPPVRDDAVERAKAITEAVGLFTQQGLEVPEYLAGLAADLTVVEPEPEPEPEPEAADETVEEDAVADADTETTEEGGTPVVRRGRPRK